MMSTYSIQCRNYGSAMCINVYQESDWTVNCTYVCVTHELSNSKPIIGGSAADKRKDNDMQNAN